MTASDQKHCAHKSKYSLFVLSEGWSGSAQNVISWEKGQAKKLAKHEPVVVGVIFSKWIPNLLERNHLIFQTRWNEDTCKIY
jgi:hypothetical protein